MVGDQYCTYCGLFHTSTQTNSFSMLFSNYQTDNNTCPFMSSSSSSSSASSSSSVDCTLSLGTPSTRLSNNIVNDNNINNDKAVQHERRRSSTYMPNFCWDMLQYPKNTPSLQPVHKTISGTDILLARRCANCDTTSTPLWRNGPRGPKSLCNACGIRFKKEERRGKAATTTTGTGSAAIPHMINGSTSSFWAHHQHQSSQSSAHPCTTPSTFGSEFRFTDQDGSETGIPFISWRLDVTDCRPSLVHGFTR